MATMNKYIDAVKMVLKKHTLNNNQPNLQSDACREMIAKDIAQLFNEKELNVDFVNEVYEMVDTEDRPSDMFPGSMKSLGRYSEKYGDR